MASSNKRRGPKPQPGPSAKRAAGSGGGSAPPRPPKGAPARSSGGIAKQWWIVIGVLVVLLIVGVVIQSTRSKAENSKVVVPKHAMGPNNSEIEGAKSAPVLLQEYADFQCPSCKAFHDAFGSTVDQLVKAKKIRYAYSYFPFIGDESVAAAAAAVCAGDQGRFFEFADLLYTNQAEENSGFLTKDQLIAFGKQAGITGAAFDTFEKCVRSDRYEGFVRDQAEAASKRGIHQTPTLFVTGPNGKTTELTGQALSSVANFQQAINTAAKS
jgi:protein-disulfide isomerase